MERNDLFCLVFSLLFVSSFSLSQPDGNGAEKSPDQTSIEDQYRGDNQPTAFEFVPEKELNQFEKAFAASLLADNGNSMANLQWLMTGDPRYIRGEVVRRSWKIFPVFRRDKYGKQNVVRLPLEKKDEIEQRALKGRQYREQKALDTTTAFLEDRADPRVQAIDHVDRILNLQALEAASTAVGDKPLTQNEIDRLASQIFYSKYRRFPDLGDPDDRLEMRKIIPRAENNTRRGRVFDFKDDFEKRKKKVVEELQKSQGMLVGEQHNVGMGGRVGELQRAFLRKLNETGESDAFVRSGVTSGFHDTAHSMLKEEIGDEEFRFLADNDGKALSRLLREREKSLKNNRYVEVEIVDPVRDERGMVVDRAYILATTEDGEQIKFRTDQDFFSDERMVRRKIDSFRERDRSKGPNSPWFDEDLKTRTVQHVERQVQSLVYDIQAAKNPKEFNDAVRKYREAVGEDRIVDSFMTAEPSVASNSFSSRGQRNLVSDIVWQGWEEDPDFWEKPARQSPGAIRWRQLMQATLDKVKGLTINLPRYARNAILTTAAVTMLFHGGKAVVTGELPDIPKIYSDTVGWVAEQTDRVSDWSRTWGEFDISSARQDKGNIDFTGDRKPTNLFDVRVNGAIDGSVHFSLGADHENRNVEGQFRINQALPEDISKSRENSDFVLETKTNIKGIRGLIPLPTPFDQNKYAQLQFLQVRSSGAGSRVEEVPLIRDHVTGTYYIDNRDGRLPKRFMYEVGFDFNDRYYISNNTPQEHRNLNTDYVKQVNEQLRAAGFTEIADGIDKVVNSGGWTSFDDIERIFAEESIYSKYPEAPEDPSKLDPKNPFTEYHQFLLDSRLCTQCNTGNMMYALFFREYDKLVDEEVERKNLKNEEEYKKRQREKVRSIEESLPYNEKHLEELRDNLLVKEETTHKTQTENQNAEDGTRQISSALTDTPIYSADERAQKNTSSRGVAIHSFQYSQPQGYGVSPIRNWDSKGSLGGSPSRAQSESFYESEFKEQLFAAHVPERESKKKINELKIYESKMMEHLRERQFVELQKLHDNGQANPENIEELARKFEAERSALLDEFKALRIEMGLDGHITEELRVLNEAVDQRKAEIARNYPVYFAELEKRYSDGRDINGLSLFIRRLENERSYHYGSRRVVQELMGEAEKAARAYLDMLSYENNGKNRINNTFTSHASWLTRKSRVNVRDMSKPMDMSTNSFGRHGSRFDRTIRPEYTPFIHGSIRLDVDEVSDGRAVLTSRDLHATTAVRKGSNVVGHYDATPKIKDPRYEAPKYPARKPGEEDSRKGSDSDRTGTMRTDEEGERIQVNRGHSADEKSIGGESDSRETRSLLEKLRDFVHDSISSRKDSKEHNSDERVKGAPASAEEDSELTKPRFQPPIEPRRQPADRPPRRLVAPRREDVDEGLIPEGEEPPETEKVKEDVVVRRSTGPLESIPPPPTEIELMHRELEGWRKRNLAKIQLEIQAVDALINKSALLKRMDPTKNAGEAHFALYRVLSDLKNLALKMSSTDTAFRNPKGELITVDEYRQMLLKELRDVEDKFFVELGNYLENNKNNPRKYPFAEAHPVLTRMFKETQKLIHEVVADLPSRVVEADLEKLRQLSDYDFDLNRGRMMYHSTKGNSCVPALKGLGQIL